MINNAGSDTGFELKYDDGRIIGASEWSKANSLRSGGGTNPMVNGEVTIPKNELRLGSEIKVRCPLVILLGSPGIQTG